MTEVAFPFEGVKTRVIPDEEDIKSKEINTESKEEQKQNIPHNESVQFSLDDDEGMDLDTLFSKGRLYGTMKLGKVTARYRSITTDESMSVEASIVPDNTKTATYILGQVSIGHMAHSIVEYQGRTLPNEYETKLEWIKSRPAFEVNLLIDGYRDFTRYCELVIRGGDLENF